MGLSCHHSTAPERKCLLSTLWCGADERNCTQLFLVAGPGCSYRGESKVLFCLPENLPQLAPLNPWDWPEELRQRIHIDFAGPLENHMFSVVVDAHSKCPQVAIMKSTSSERTIEELRSIFSRFGLTQQLVTKSSRHSWKRMVVSISSLPHITLAERFVQTMKQALKSSQGTQSLNRHRTAFLSHHI